MAGEIAQDVAVMMALSSAAIGASGAIASQVVAGLITGRREQRQSEAETERWKTEADAKRRDRQLDRKIEVFSNFLSTAEDIAHVGIGLHRSIPDVREKLRGWSEQMKKLTEEIGILAPELYEIARSTARSAWEVDFMFPSHGYINGARTLTEADNDDSTAKRREARLSLSFWSETFRTATRNYISHEPIQSHWEAEQAHTAMLQRDREIQRSL